MNDLAVSIAASVASAAIIGAVVFYTMTRVQLALLSQRISQLEAQSSKHFEQREDLLEKIEDCRQRLSRIEVHLLKKG